MSKVSCNCQPLNIKMFWIFRNMFCNERTVDAFIRYLEKNFEMEQYIKAHQAVWIPPPPQHVYKCNMVKKFDNEHSFGQQGKRLDRRIEEARI